MTDYGYTTISIHEDTKPTFQKAKRAVENDLGEEVTQDETIEELARAYLRQRACDGGARYGGRS